MLFVCLFGGAEILMFGSVIHFEVTFVKGIKSVSRIFFLFFACGCSLVSALFLTFFQ